MARADSTAPIEVSAEAGPTGGVPAAPDVLEHLASGRALNRAILEQCTALLHGLSAACMVRSLPTDPCNTIGGHLRHLLDHHEALLRGLEEGKIDYGARRRNTPCERDPSLALARVEALSASLAALTPEDEARSIPLLRENGETTLTTVARELDFVASHATHHLAIVSVLATVFGLQMPPQLGVAVSTLRHRRALGDG